MQEQKLKTNLDTNFIKIIAVISMTIDHAGAVFFSGISGVSLDRKNSLSAFLLLSYGGNAVYTRYKEIFIKAFYICAYLAAVLDIRF